MMAELPTEEKPEPPPEAPPTAPELPGSAKKFFRKHWNMLVLFVVGAILASIGAILVYLWVVGYAQLTGLVPATLGQWTMGNIVTILLHMIFWEVLLIGVPIIVAAVAIIWLWWKKLPDEERQEYGKPRDRRRTTGEGSISPLIFIAFCIKVFLDGNWDVAFATWTFDYVVYSFLSALIWVSIIFGIPMALGILWWIRREMK